MQSFVIKAMIIFDLLGHIICAKQRHCIITLVKHKARGPDVAAQVILYGPWEL